MMSPGAFAEIFVAGAGLVHLVCALFLGAVFAVPSLFVQWRGGGSLAGALLRSQIPALIAAAPSLLGALACFVGVAIVASLQDHHLRNTLEGIALYSVLVPPIPGFVLGLVAFILYRRVVKEEGGL
jgi:hypothetical protein